MQVNMIISELAKIINNCNVSIAMYWLKSQTTSHDDFTFRLVCDLSLLFANIVGH